jgi:ubiquinone/menaquinone biosynthesis C-methylase UbiE
MTQAFFNNKARFFDRWAPNYDCLLTTVFYQAVHQRLLSFVRLPEHSHILDLGCGTGRLLDRLASQFPNLYGIGLDLSAEMLRQARRSCKYRQSLIYIQGNAEALPFADRQFDAVFNTISFLHYPHPEKVFAQVQRVIKPCGYFYLVDYTVSKMFNFPFSPGGLRFYTPQQREEFAENVGLKVIGHHYLISRVLLTVFTG